MPLFVLVACIILHDMNPRREIVQTRHCPSDNMVSWNGDCWRAAVALRVINELEIVVVDIDHGVGVIRKRPNTASGRRDFYWRVGGTSCMKMEI
jgi:hypothetical protein